MDPTVKFPSPKIVKIVKKPPHQPNTWVPYEYFFSPAPIPKN